jgi:RNA polymerase sigma-70 factor, ECF subfamily
VYTYTIHFGNRRDNVDFQAFDSAYVERLRAGDRATEDHFIAYFGELIDLKLRSRLASRQAIEDVKQETFARCLQLLRSAGGVRNAERLGPLVNSICNHVLSEHFRTNSRTEALDDQPADRFIAHEPDALTRVITDDTRRMVRQVLEKLPKRDQTILRAVFLEEREKDDLCREIGVTRDYIRVLLHRAKQSFREVYMERTAGRQTC